MSYYKGPYIKYNHNPGGRVSVLKSEGVQRCQKIAVILNVQMVPNTHFGVVTIK